MTRRSPASADDSGEDAPVTPAQARAAGALWRAAAAVLETGIPGAGEATRAGLVRAAHDARAAGLHRAATAAIRVVEHLRAASTEDPAFRLDDLVGDLRELLSVAHHLRQPQARLSTALRGTARREYRAAAGARLYGLCVEPIATASGYAGAATLLADDSGGIWQVSTVVPGGADVARFAARRPVPVGEVGLSHAELGRAGLLASAMRTSTDGRISGGRGTAAVAAEGVSWWEPPLDQLWRQPFTQQIERYLAGLEAPPVARPAAAGLLFLDAIVAGVGGGGVGMLVERRRLVAVAAHDSPELSYVDNLRLLGRAVGATVRLVVRPVGRRIAPIAVAAAWLPEAYGGHVDLGLDRLRPTDLPVPETVAPPRVEGQPSEIDAAPPLRPLRRRVERAVEGGRAAVPGDRSEVEHMRVFLPTAGEVAEELEAAAQPRTPSAEEFAQAWLAAATYLHAVGRRAERDDWLRPESGRADRG